MLQISFIKNHKEEVIRLLALKNFNHIEILDKAIQLDEERKSIQKKLDEKLTESNKITKEIGFLLKNGKTHEANELKQKTTELKNSTKELNDVMLSVQKQLDEIILEIPNLPHHSVSKGNSSDDNEIIFESGQIPVLNDNAKAHWDLAKDLNIIDFDLGNKVTGAGFPFYINKGASLQRALINFFIEEAIKKGYIEVQPPIFVNKDSAFATGQLPDKEGQMYHIQKDDLYPIPTAEVPLTNIYRNCILKESDFPIKIVAYSNCFRREAGSYGKEVRGLNRLHQFDKVEIVQIQHPNHSYDTLEEMKNYVALLLQKLELPYRILKLCGADMSFTSALTYDFEVYAAAQKKWLEVSSVSNFETYQSNRLKLRFKDENGKNQLAHTLNGSALALPRIVAALLENNQTTEGIKIPTLLQSYTGYQYIK